MLSRLEKGETQVICNVGVLSTGVDLPFLRGIIMSRPTKSYNLYIHQMGRGTRPFDGKQNFIVLDHAMNIAEHGFMEDDPECNLDGEPARTPSVTICEACFVAFNSRLHRGVCPECGYKKPIEDRPTKERKVIVASEIDLREITVDQLTPNERLKVNKAIWRLCKTAALKRYKPGWVYHKIKEQFGVKIANDKWEEIQCQIQSTIQTSY
jgi:superfamily II DNA or RNA helicase